MNRKTERSQRPIWLGADKRQWDHVRVHTQLLYDTRLDAYCLAVYMGLVSHAELNSGECFPGLETLSEYANIHRTTVKKAVDLLRETGYVEFIDQHGRTIEPNPDPRKRTGKSHRYRVLPPPALSDEFNLSTRRAQSDTSKNTRSRSQDMGSRCEHIEVAVTAPLTRTNKQEPDNKNDFQVSHSVDKSDDEDKRRASEILAELPVPDWLSERRGVSR
jgi:biotin operon repressor